MLRLVTSILVVNALGVIAAYDVVAQVRPVADHFYEPTPDPELVRSGRMIGVGLLLKRDTKNNAILVKEVVPFSPASSADIEPGDMIVEINGKSTKDASLTECLHQIRGESGSRLRLTLLRDDREHTVELVRDEYGLPERFNTSPTDP